MAFQILAINADLDGITIGRFIDEEEMWRDFIPPLEGAPPSEAGYERQLELTRRVLRHRSVEVEGLSAVVGSAGVIGPVAAGVFAVGERLFEALLKDQHPSSMGGVLAYAVSQPFGIPAFVVDPVSVDEMDEVARLTGLPELARLPYDHALACRALARRAASDLGKEWPKVNLVVAYLNSASSVCAFRGGRMAYVNNPDDSGPFSTKKAGGIVALDLARIAYGGQYSKDQLMKRLTAKGGMVAHLGTADLASVKRRIEAGDEKTRLVYEAMAYNVAKEIGSCAAVLNGEVNAVIISGEVARDASFVAQIQDRVRWIAPVLCYPGKRELLALAEGALRALTGVEPVGEFGDRIAS
ncbi:MAG TPA: butyrate kinase [Synergistaceae bacterium]|nr:butyrate kinase [Synergistaceae bacterium]